MPPHSRSSRLSRFGSVHATSASDNPPTAQMIHQARCKITEKKISSPVAAQVSSDSSCLAVLVMVRRQELKYPVLHYYRHEEDTNPVYAAGVTIFTELSDIAYHMTTDEERKLLFVSDGTRVKSFRWDTDITISRHEESTGAAVHTMRCDRYEGAIEMLPNGYLVRAGRGEAAIWDLDTLKTHEGGRRIGTGRFVEYGPFDEERTGPWGKSTGSHPTSTVNFEEKTLYPWVFHYHRPAAKLLAAETQNGSGRHGYVSLDLEHGGRAAVQYTGHAGDVHAISSSAGDPNTFATACADSLDPDDSEANQAPKRARNAHAGRNVRQRTSSPSEGEDDEDNDSMSSFDEDEEDDYDGDYDPVARNGGEYLWPHRASKREDYYGYTYSESAHRNPLFGYQFKETPDKKILPLYERMRLRRR
ncbi:hypothetical protein C8Q80DRAFT_1353188 [Daedaleopsis nitida]|nr:hypothetical protein C8Q80DRAFT_1353188 [Daedaleopsis nitida]